MKIVLLTIAIASGAANAPSDTRPRFDLDCKGVTRPMRDVQSTGPTEPWHRTFSIDPDRGLAFIHGSQGVMNLTISPDTLVAGDPDLAISINRSTGYFNQMITMVPGMETVSEGKCVVQPYTSMPSRAF